MAREYEVDSLVQLPDDIKMVRHGEVLEREADAREMADGLTAAGVPAWVHPVEVTGPDPLRGEV